MKIPAQMQALKPFANIFVSVISVYNLNDNLSLHEPISSCTFAEYIFTFSESTFFYCRLLNHVIRQNEIPFELVALNQ